MQKRSRYFIDKQVQGALAFRVAYYWVLCMWGMFCLLAAFPIASAWISQSPDAAKAWEIIHATWLSFRFPFVASFLVVPFLIRDVIRVSHRHIGPIYRLRNALRDLADGKPVPTVRFRQSDMWGDLADEFNRVAARLQDTDLADAAESEEAAEDEQPALV